MSFASQAAIGTRFPGVQRGAIAVILLCGFIARGAVVINEFMAASSEQRLSWGNDNVPWLGPGARWQDPGFNAAGWSACFLPAGYGFGGLSKDLTTEMKDKTPSLYLRKSFTVSSAVAASTNTLTLAIQYNDGFVAYLNGREVARANCGFYRNFLYCSQAAYNVNSDTNVINFALGGASSWLVVGSNVLAIQVHNAEKPSTLDVPEQITQHIPTPEFRINAALRCDGADLIALGPSGGQWQYLVGRYEPSGGIVDTGLVTRVFSPPTGEEDDYDQPAEFGDWIELFNDGGAAVNLGGWSLSDDPDLPAKWRFPTNTTLPAGGFLLVMCDNRDEANAPAGPAARLHTNFKLDENGDFLGLYDAAGQWVDGFPTNFPEQVFNCSYGRNPTNPAAFGFLASATPGAVNSGEFYPNRAPPPRFLDAAGNELHGGIYLTQPLVLTLACDLPGATIRFTVNGTEPTELTGFTYTAPLVLNQSTENAGIVVRARALFPGLLPSKVKTHTYLLRQPAALANYPVLLFTAHPSRSFYAPYGELAIVGGTYVTGAKGMIWMANGPQCYNNVLGVGTPFERHAHMEYFPPPGYYPTNQGTVGTDVGMRVSSSSYSRPRMTLSGVSGSPWNVLNSNDKPSFNLYFSDDYGGGTLDYRFFTNYPVRKFNQLRLRAGKNDIANPFITDELVRRLWLEMGHVGSRGLFCSMYLNATYKGVFNLCERLRESFFQEHYNSSLAWDVDYIWSWVSGDRKAFDQLLAALDQNLTNQVNWQSVTNKIDLDNAADYYLLNIWCAMWDWPGNNFCIARERSTGPNSLFRLAVWDAEGAFNVIGYGHPVSYNTITSDLVLPPSDQNYWSDLPRIFRRLASAPEFRLRFADRINRHMFNGGLLDDRDPDGAGPRASRVRQMADNLAVEVGPMVQYNCGQPINLGAIYNWFSDAGRRSYLLGTAAGRRMFRDAGLWPVTEPPVFSQFGGGVPPGFALSMTSYVAVGGQTSTIYYTLDGSDPRLVGGALSPQAAAYAGPVTLPAIATVKARARNNTTSEWSPLTEAAFGTAVVPASATNLVVAELMYHPPGASVAELAAGFSNADDFEFIRLNNIGSMPVDLSGVRFDLGVSFDFTSGAVRYVAPGGNVLVVKSRAAFQARYGHGCDALIAGEYGGNLSNGGEQVRLLAQDGSVICDLTYADTAPWPAAADGYGPSLVLANPWSAPDPANPASWTVSALPGGMPSGSPVAQTYAAWSALCWAAGATNIAVAGPAADPDGDGINNFLEYAFGLNPSQPSVFPAPTASIDFFGGENRLLVTVRVSAAAPGAHLLWEASPDLRTWSDVTSSVQLFNTAAVYDGSAIRTYLDGQPILPQASRFLRLRFAGPY